MQYSRDRLISLIRKDREKKAGLPPEGERPAPTALPPSPAPETPPPPPARERRYPLRFRFGRIPLEGTWPVLPNLFRLAGLDPPRPEAPPPRPLFLDSETTGLAGGTGTLAFLLGLAWLDLSTGELVVEQRFLPDPASEREFLAPLSERLAAADLLVCFNGKSYDLPLLNTRFILNGLPEVPGGLPVVDLLHPARRRWKAELDACDQRTLEREVLGFRRSGDIPGEFIPPIYFQYLRDRDLGPVEAVFEHNRLDMLGMAALFARLNTMVTEDGPAAGPADWHCLLHALETHRRLDDFRALRELCGPSLLEAGRRHLPLGLVLARLLKRAGFREEACELNLFLAGQRPGQAGEALLEALKHLEHVRRDFDAGIALCLSFEETLRAVPGSGPLRAEVLARRERMRRKAERPVLRRPGKNSSAG